jgi:hypothetical protein
VTVAQLVFRDGPREVPEHVEAMLRGIEVYRLTYGEALAEANRRAESAVVSKAMSKSINDHFRSGGR